MRHKCIAVALCSIGLVGCAVQEGKSVRPNRSIVDDNLQVICEGDFDRPPQLQAGKAPIFPIKMLNPYVIEDRKVRRLPMQWPVESSFIVDSDGKTSQVASTPTDPPSFGHHTTIAIRGWRFLPAQQEGRPVTANCKFAFEFQLD